MTLRTFGYLITLGVLPSFTYAPPPAAGTIVYVHAPDESAPWPTNDIYSMRADGTGAKALTNDGHSHNPAPSPDGRQILFIHDTSLSKPVYPEQKKYESHHSVELYVMDVDGGNRRLIRRIEPVIHSAAWSPDGKTLAITCMPEAPSDGQRGQACLYLMSADGTGDLRLIARNAFTPAWSPDGKKLAFSVENPRGKWALHVANADGSNDIALTDPNRLGGSPSWSPDGTRIAYSEFVDQGQRRHVFIMNADGSGVRQLTRNPKWSCNRPSWSPDGNHIAVSCGLASSPCGMVSSVGTIMPCVRRIFLASLIDPNAEPIQLTQHDSAFAEFLPK